MRRLATALAAVLIAVAAAPAGAIPSPELMAEVGRTFAVDSPKNGQFDQGGFSMALSFLWPVEDLLRIGVSGFADDLGSLTTELSDPSTNPPTPLGLFNLAHANVYGGAWRMEVIGPRWRKLDTFARGDFGFYQFRTDQQGDELTESMKVGWSLGGGVMFPLRANHAIGATIAYDRTFSDFTRGFMSAGVAWHWRPGFRSSANGAKH